MQQVFEYGRHVPGKIYLLNSLVGHPFVFHVCNKVLIGNRDLILHLLIQKQENNCFKFEEFNVSIKPGQFPIDKFLKAALKQMQINMLFNILVVKLGTRLKN